MSHVQFSGRKRDLRVLSWLRPCVGASRRAQSTLVATHSTVGAGPEYSGRDPEYSGAAKVTRTATHTNVKCSQSTRLRRANIAHVPHRHFSGRKRGLRARISVKIPGRALTVPVGTQDTVVPFHLGSPLRTMPWGGVPPGRRPKASPRRCSPKTCAESANVRQIEIFYHRRHPLKNHGIYWVFERCAPLPKSLPAERRSQGRALQRIGLLRMVDSCACQSA